MALLNAYLDLILVPLRTVLTSACFDLVMSVEILASGLHHFNLVRLTVLLNACLGLNLVSLGTVPTVAVPETIPKSS